MLFFKACSVLYTAIVRRESLARSCQDSEEEAGWITQIDGLLSFYLPFPTLTTSRGVRT